MKLDLETRFRYNECSFSSNDHFKILEKCALNTNQEIRKWHQRWWVKDLASFTSYAMIDWLLSFCLFRELYVVIVSSPLLSKIKYKYGLSANDVFSINDVAWRSRYARRKIYGNHSRSNKKYQENELLKWICFVFRRTDTSVDTTALIADVKGRVLMFTRVTLSW